MSQLIHEPINVDIDPRLRTVLKKSKNKNILILGHSDPLWMLEGAVKGLNNKDFFPQVFINKDYIKVGQLKKIN